MIKLFIVRKYVMAKNVSEALKIEKTKEADDVWLDDDWKKENLPKTKTKNIGF